MLMIHAKQGKAWEQAADLLVVPQFQGGSLKTGVLAEINSLFDGKLMEALEADRFVGKVGESIYVPTFGALKARKILVVGLGDKAKFTLDGARKWGGQIAKRAQSAKVDTVSIAWPTFPLEASSREVAEAFAEGMWLGSYTFHTFRGKLYESQRKDVREVERVTLYDPERAKVSLMERGIEEARVFAEGTMLARTLVNTPSGHMAPSDLAKVAEQIAAKSKRISLEHLDIAKMEALGMEAALAVGRGSDHAPVGIHLIYRPLRKTKKKVALVGKAVTFDSGGLSIKPADGMMTMKIDMAGAASVLGVFQALSELEVDVEVHGIFLAVENMPSGKAYRPGDVVKAMNGTTIEVLNTDAEGRVTLADALSYAQTFKPDVIIDLATLTGACVVALGEDVAGLMSPDKKLSDRLLTAAEQAGEALWPLPLFEPYQELIKSKVADIKNIGGRAAGTITAALFLQHFVEKTPWAHLDIAGPAYAEKETRPDIPFGGTGYGVRTLLRYLQSL